MNPSSAARLFHHLLPGLILAAVATALFSWNPFGRLPQHATFEAVVRSSVPGEARLLPDIKELPNDCASALKGAIFTDPKAIPAAARKKLGPIVSKYLR